jgi:hypothetical protein
VKQDEGFSVSRGNIVAFARLPANATLLAGWSPDPRERLFVYWQEWKQFAKKLSGLTPGIAPFGKIAPLTTGKLFRFPNRRESVFLDNLHCREL